MVYFRSVGAHIILFDNIFVKRDQNESKTEKKLKHLKKSYNHSQDIDYVLLKNNSVNLIMVVNNYNAIKESLFV